MTFRFPHAVLDTNIVVSAVLTRDGLESQILRLALSGEVHIYTSLPILDEYAEVLARPKFRLSAGGQQRIVEGLKSAATTVAPRHRITACSDPGDNMFLECAEAARADYLITGNLRHFPVAWKLTRVVSSRQFLSLYSK